MEEKLPRNPPFGESIDYFKYILHTPQITANTEELPEGTKEWAILTGLV
ncbi:hypothetical protein L6773_12090 [Rhodohalobacter sp. WB101]|uniref:Uncharacterized protein n=1 Tax=Rhodohalobacter sulfatireducens TaxID=2911366 RepID=A0ABS9KEN8_9BACT|nr:hypothetical protein [Rhodohalobacter sulfatireducens]